MEDCVVQVREFTKRYGTFTAVNSISFEVGRGEVFGLLGPNGAGKTTTLECLEGLRQPDAGILRIMGLDPARDAARLRDLIGVQLQSSAMPENITVREAMRFFCAYHGVAPRFDLIERFGLSAKSDTQFSMLSTGQKRRLALALAIAHRPQVLFLDEPTAGLDVSSRAELHDIIRELNGDGTTIILSSHDMAEVEKLVDRVAILLRGAIAAIGSPYDLTATGAGLTKITVQSEGDSLSDGQMFPGVQQQTVVDHHLVYFSTAPAKTVAALLEHLAQHDDALIDLRVERPSLEERFLEITRADPVTTPELTR